MSLKLNEEMVLCHIASGAISLKEAMKKINRSDFSPAGQELFDALAEVQRKEGGINAELFIQELRNRESIAAFGGEESVLAWVAIARSISFEEEALLLKEKAATHRIAQLASSENSHEAIRLIRNELVKIPTAVSKKLQMQWLSERPVNFLEVDAPPKPRLMYWTAEDGLKTPFLHREIIAMLVGAGGVGKTHLVAHLAISAITGIPFLGKFEFDAPCNVCLVAGENSEGDLHLLLRKSRLSIEEILRENDMKREHERFGLHSPKPFLNAASRLMVCLVQGMNARFIQPDDQPTEFFKNFKAELKAKEPESGWQLIILDPLSRFAGLDTEKDNGLATSFIALLEELILDLKGHPTILVCHHKPKAAVSSSETDQTASRGAGALTDGVRWQANLDRDEENPNDISLLGIVKSNFTSFPPRIRIKKSKNGCPRFDEFTLKKTKKRGSPNNDQCP